MTMRRRRLRYVNCGHNPPIPCGPTAAVEWLQATATVLGLFEEWDCSVAELELAAGDVLVIYTDGISEASPNEEDEFGEERLIAAAQHGRVGQPTKFSKPSSARCRSSAKASKRMT